MPQLKLPLACFTLEALSERVLEMERAVRDGGSTFWEAQGKLPFAETVVASLIREWHTMIVIEAARHRRALDLRRVLAQ